MIYASPEAWWLTESEEVVSGGLRSSCRMSLVRWLGGDAAICFCMPVRTKGAAYYVGGGGRGENGSWRKL